MRACTQTPLLFLACSPLIVSRIQAYDNGRNGRPPSAIIELNPLYRPNARPDTLTLGDLEDERFPDRQSIQLGNGYNNGGSSYSHNVSERDQPPPLRQLIYTFFINLHNLSPTLSCGTFASVFVYILWQIPVVANGLLRNHFICSRYTVLEKKRVHAMLLSAVSHASFRHLFLNIYAFFTFGPTVNSALRRKRIPLYTFVLGSALLGSLCHLLLSPHAGSIGLSGVTFAMVAFVARLYPARQFKVMFFPRFSIYSQHALIFAFIVSIIGALSGQAGGLAHATHLGGLIFGVLFHEAFESGTLMKKNVPSWARSEN